jgi:hypothetical protein
VETPRLTTVLGPVRRVCSSLPEVVERPSHGTPSFFVRGKRCFAMAWDDHHGDGRLALWCAAAPGVAPSLIAEEPARFFRPPYVGSRGWLGVDLAADPDGEEVAAILRDAYRAVAPKTLAALV